MKICCACGKEKEYKNFNVDNSKKDGRYARCKMCVSNKKCCKRGRNNGINIYDPDYKEYVLKKFNKPLEGLRLRNTSKEDYVYTYLFLQKIGYSLSESIHQQFCDKHGFETIEREEFRFYFSPKDCGLT